MYVIPFSMGPVASPLSKLGIQVTDSAYVAANMNIMTRMGSEALARINEGAAFVPCMHSVGQPLTEENAGTTDYISARLAMNRVLRAQRHFA